MLTDADANANANAALNRLNHTERQERKGESERKGGMFSCCILVRDHVRLERGCEKI